MRIDSVQVPNDIETLITAVTQTTTLTGAQKDGYVNADAVIFVANVTASSGTTPTLDIKIQDSIDSGATWQDTGIAFTQITTVLATTSVRTTTPLAPMIRAVCTIGGTTPSYTFTVRAYGKAKKVIVGS